ncbi:type III restriction-modification system endonuclease [Sedimenticola selenatireducens]|uniref:DEAD/DEAH box helicase n=2 Tax=Sedimenticola TaxID=349742 RepID=A0A558CX79_9GAMM|nr:DEAD/DEAH box helicase family protein [Sedimenticola selenatireducens]TVO69724.1 DEAD/DEAH box helicase [Sedimenticola selenatireducens]TVT53370.1 MAG: DEAD/DEAH box helicase [Sedimenticola thiotaurini]TVT62208.1 MAG: DEAD/DEAH box helicase [Sedimenticola selenatireducens]
MKLHFEPNLDYQMQAIEAVCDLFRGQEICRTEFTVTMKAPATADSDLFPGTQPEQMTLGMAESDLGVGNRLTLLDDELHKNLADIQLRGGLPPSGSLTSGDFTVEMETGTGKTYVYLRSIFELNKRYGFSKFVIVVPSVAIKEGVYKTLQITEDHFKGLYAGVPFDYFLYDSSKLGQVRNFATSSNIQIMVVTVGAINKKDVNNLYKDSEKTGGEKPIDLIKATRPVLIVDEPQSVDGGLKGAGKTALDAMNPLCTLRYSATHVDKHHMVFRLDAVDAYERKLVKQIEVASATVENAHNKPYVRLVAVSNKRGTISAKIALDMQMAGGVQRQEVTVQDGDDLEQTSKRAIYADFRVGEINTAKGEEFMELRYPGGEAFLAPGQAHGDVDALAVQREMIRRTIREHLDKEKRLRPLGIKVLSLFFIDEVARYRTYDADGNAVKGDYARIFEEEYRRAAKLPAYQSLFTEIDLDSAAEEVHNGYFSIDKKGGWSDTAENNAGNRENAERAYNLIMKEKEKLLGFETPLKFIFSHSALKEGWDNPNVFQICTLRDIQTERERRQTIGRGLRLCVNQKGERVRGFEVNTLTVVATENYQQFAEALQKEIEDDTGIRFGVVEPHQFAAITVVGEDGEAAPLGMEQSQALWNHLKAAGHIDAKGKVQDSLKTALKDGTLTLPAEFDAQKGQIAEVLRKLSGRLEIRNADERKQIALRKGQDGKAIYLSEEFKALWDRIKHQTTYRVQFDNDKLVTDCIASLQKAPYIAKARLQWRKADIAIGKAGVEATEKAGAATVVLDESDIELPDVLTDLQDRTHLTRRTITSILTGSGRLDDFKRNPQQFIELASGIINRCKRLALVDGIKYQKLGDQHIYAQELFEQEELTGYLKNLLLDTQKSIYEHVVYDSTTEHDFADALEKNDAIKLYVKLPGWFKVPTPLGSYNPDWAVLVEEDGTERLYFVVETKSSLFTDDLRDKESAKIECGKAHFAALAEGDNPARYVVARSLDDVLNEAAGT